MRLIIIVIIGITFSSCLNQNQNDDYLSRDIQQLNKRIDFVSSTFKNQTDSEYSSTRHTSIFQEIIQINSNFKEIEVNFVAGEPFHNQITSIKESLQRTSHWMYYTENSIDDLVQHKFVNDLEELKRLKTNESESRSEIEKIHSIKTVQEGILNTFFTLSRTDKYTFNKVEPLTIDRKGNGFEIKQGDSLEVSIFLVAYDTTAIQKIEYWIDDSTRNNSNVIKHDYGFIKVGGEKGVHTVVGTIGTNPNNREDKALWEFKYTVE
jgi:hypothetical protein